MHNGNLCHTAYHASNLGYPSTIAGFLQNKHIKPTHYPIRTTYVKDLGGEWHLAENCVDWTRLPNKKPDISDSCKSWNQRVTVFERPHDRADGDIHQYDSLVGDVDFPEAATIPERGPGSRPRRPIEVDADAAACVYLDQQFPWEVVPEPNKQTNAVSDSKYRHYSEAARVPDFDDYDACLKRMKAWKSVTMIMLTTKLIILKL